MQELLHNHLRIFTVMLTVYLIMGCHAPGQQKHNNVILFLESAELQVETYDQLRELERALEDIVSLPARELQQRRYADYQMNKGAWTLRKILSAYFLSQYPLPIDLDRFYGDVAAENVKSLVREKISQIQNLEFN
ncbi:MAG: hypothetical protein LGR52_13920 [Candidatus Thiosymbion ectosymbiont of Robbea hypermnestra]|nr:hypothetical protein [Candidatus Thiosymbion ectosymbiont of Robbea hypermnestra]